MFLTVLELGFNRAKWAIVSRGFSYFVLFFSFYLYGKWLL